MVKNKDKVLATPAPMETPEKLALLNTKEKIGGYQGLLGEIDLQEGDIPIANITPDMLYNVNILRWLSESLQLDGGFDVVLSPVVFHVLHKHLLFVPPRDDCHQKDAQHTDGGLQMGRCQEGIPGGGPGPARGGKQKGRDQQGLSIRKGLLQSGRQVK